MSSGCFSLFLPTVSIAELGRELCQRLVCNPPYHFRWMRLVKDDETNNMRVNILCEPETGADQAIGRHALIKKHKQDVLAIRGCIAYGLVFYALHARHRVNYGLSSKSGKILHFLFLQAIHQKIGLNLAILIWRSCIRRCRTFTRAFPSINSRVHLSCCSNKGRRQGN